MLAGFVTKENDIRSWGLRLLIGHAVRGAKNYNPYSLVFGDDSKVCAEASPVKNVQKGLPPFLLINAEWDLPTLPKMAKEFAAKLQEEGNSVIAVTLKHRDHNTIVFRSRSIEDRLGQAVMDFIGKHGK
jgi:acetyl esterase/lipase